MLRSPDPLQDEASALLRRLGFGDVGTLNETLHCLASVGFRCARLQGAGVLSANEASEANELGNALHQLLRARRHRSAIEVDLNQILEETLRVLCCDIGFERTMAFVVGDGCLEVVGTSFVQDDGWATEVHARAVAEPPELAFDILEAAVVDAQQMIVVSDPQRDHRMWRPIVESSKTASYVAAPIVVGGETVALVHADRWFSGRQVTEHDRDLLGLVAFERSAKASQAVSRPQLSARQGQVMELVAEGATSIQVARRLCISPETVKTHLKNIYAELGVNNRTQAAQIFRSGR